MQARNGFVELYRFIAALGIALFHYEWVYMGTSCYLGHLYIFVEFFFVLSGFFLAQNCKKAAAEVSAWEYVGRQIKKLYPLYLLAVISSAWITGRLMGWGGASLPLIIWQDKWEILLSYVFGWGGTVYNNGGASAYVPALLFASLILYELLRSQKRLFTAVVGPILIVCGYSRILSVCGNLSVWLQFDELITLGVVRAFAGMSVGILFSEVVMPALAKGKKPILFAVVAICTYGCVGLVLYRNYIGYSDLLFFVLLFALLITCLSLLRLPPLLNRTCCYLGKLSYPIFLFHYTFLEAMKCFLPDMPYVKGILVFLTLLLVCTASLLFLKKGLYSLRNRIA